MENFRHASATHRYTTLLASLLLPLPLFLLSACGQSGGAAQKGSLTDANRAVMSQYEEIRAALAADDLRDAKKASARLADTLKPASPTAPASAMLEPAQSIADAPALDKARQAFKKLSAEAVRVTSGVNGYYAINCPMTPEGDWVQTNQTIDNPYMGKIMHDCGVLKK